MPSKCDLLKLTVASSPEKKNLLLKFLRDNGMLKEGRTPDKVEIMMI
jgi:hypothetical protein